MPPGHQGVRRRCRWWVKRANETAVERETRLQERRDWRFHQLLNEPLEDRFFRQYIDRIHAQDRRKSETPEERAARIEKCRLRARVRRMLMLCRGCGKSYPPHQLIKSNGSSDPLLQEPRPAELMLCPQCHRQLEKWVNVIRKSRNDPAWLPSSRTVICSMHFHDDDFYITKRGLRRVKKNAYPKIVYTLQHQNVFYEVNETSVSSGAEQPSCSSFADSDMEEEHPEEKPDPTAWLEIKQEVLWGDEQSSKEPGAAQAEQPTGEAAPPRGERGILEELRREMGTMARRDEVSSGLEEIRQQIRELAQGDEFDAFGRYVASLLRNMRPRRASHAQPLLINLLAAEMMKQNDDDLP